MSNQEIKAKVRAWMQHRIMEQGPPPGMDQIRRAVGWVPAKCSVVTLHAGADIDVPPAGEAMHDPTMTTLYPAS